MKTLLNALTFLTYKLPRNIIIGVIVLYTLFGFFIVPLIMESQVEKFITESYKEKVQIEKIFFNPYTFELEVKKFAIPDTTSGGIDKSRLTFNRLYLNLEIFPLFVKEITFKEASFEGAHVYLSFYKQQKNNWTSSAPKKPEEKKESSGSPWTLVLKKLSFDKDYFQFRDFNYPTPVNLPLGPLSLKASNVSTTIGNQSALESLFINLGDQGSLLLKGKVSLSPPSADIHLTAKKFPLNFLTAYMSNTTYLSLNQGSLDFNGNIDYDKAVFSVKGDAQINNFSLISTKDQTDILKIKKADFQSLFYSTAPAKFTLEAMVFDELKSYVLLKPDGTLNYKELMKPTPASQVAPTTSETATAETKKPGLNYKINTIKLINGQLDYNDWQIKPKFIAHIHTLNGDIGPLSNNPENKIDIALNGMVEDQGKFTSKGYYFQSIKPLDLNLDVKFANIEMTTFTPYSGHFMGYEIKKGKLFLDVNYTLKKNRIVGKNKVRLDQFTLGEKVESKNSTNLPLKLAVALLKDRKGQIKFNLPLEGETNSPKFSYGSAIRTALFNMIVNIVMSPFDFLADVFGVGKEVQLIEFENQLVTFKVGNENKIDSVTRILEERPELRLEILGTCSEKEFLVEGAKEQPVIEEAQYKEIGLKRAQLVQNLLAKKGISAERLFVMAGKKNDDSIGKSGAVLIFKAD
nr:DUF748 domain-containing protein [Bacteriovorax sp. HI3]